MASFKFDNIYLDDAYVVAGPYEVKGKIKDFDYTFLDLRFGEKCFDDAEVKMQKIAIEGVLDKTGTCESDIGCIVGGDLSNQLTTSSVTGSDYKTSFLGVYGACSTFNESLIVGCSLLNMGLNKVLTVTSSHNLNSEKQFRYPVEYGAPKRESTTFTATGAVATILSRNPGLLKIESATIGQVIDYGIKDANNMGAVMAPAAYETIMNHLKDMNREVNYYDLIVTGDLGSVGKILLKKLFLKKGIKLNNHIDAGMEIYLDSQDVKAGASGPSAMPLSFFSKIIKNPKNKKILLVATGSLHSPALVNQKNTIPSIAHAVSVEVLK